jgi:hypothetical protein
MATGAETDQEEGKGTFYRQKSRFEAVCRFIAEGCLRLVRASNSQNCLHPLALVGTE